MNYGLKLLAPSVHSRVWAPGHPYNSVSRMRLQDSHHSKNFVTRCWNLRRSFQKLHANFGLVQKDFRNLKEIQSELLFIFFILRKYCYSFFWQTLRRKYNLNAVEGPLEIPTETTLLRIWSNHELQKTTY